MSSQYIIVHDVGTSGNKAVLVDAEGNIHASAFRPYPIHYPHPNWAEQEPEDWWGAVTATTKQVMEQSGVAPQQVLAMVYTTQMLTFVPMGAGNRGQRYNNVFSINERYEQGTSLGGVISLQCYHFFRINSSFVKLLMPKGYRIQDLAISEGLIVPDYGGLIFTLGHAFR